MEEKRNPKSWGQWLIVGPVLLVGYPLSMQPVFSLVNLKVLPFRVVDVYGPLYGIAKMTPSPICDWWWEYSMRLTLDVPDEEMKSPCGP